MDKITKIKTIKFSSPLDRLVSIAEYSIFVSGQHKYAEMIVYNSSSNTVNNFEMKIESFDDNNIKLSTSILNINNISLKPNLYLKLNTKIPLPIDAVGFNYLTLGINSNSRHNLNNSDVDHFISSSNGNKNIDFNFKTSPDQIVIRNVEAATNKIENVYRKEHLSPKQAFLVPFVSLAVAFLTTIYFDVNAGNIVSSPTRTTTFQNYKISERRDFSYTVSTTNITLNKYNNRKTMLYFDPTVYIANYSGQTISIQKDCFAFSSIKRIVIQGPCEISDGAFYNCKDLEAFVCVHYTVNDMKFDGNVNLLGKESFYNCENLKTFSCDEFKPSELSDYSFYNCKELVNYVLPSVSVIGEGTFYGCKKLPKTYKIPESVKTILSKAYQESSISEVIFENINTRKMEDSFDDNVTFIGSSIYDSDGKEI